MSATSAEKRSISPLVIVSFLGFVVLIIAALFWLNQQQEETTPADDSAEVGFARDMIVHHSQAVDMGLILYDRTAHDQLKLIALDIVLTQQNQIGQMQGWLELWGVPYAGSDLPMTWMGMATEGLMPGMATDEQMDALRATTSADVDAMFIELMIAHHRSGVHMAEAVLEKTDNAAVERLAQSIINSQQQEIATLEQIGASLGMEPAPEATVEPGEHSDH